MDALKKQNAIGGFIPGLAKRDGYALWNKSQVKQLKKIPTYNRNGENDDVVEVFTPIVQQDSNFVNGFFFSKVVGDSVELHLYRGNDYDLYPFGKTDSTVVTAELITCKLVELDALAFGARKYKIKDSSLFKMGSPVKPGDSSVTVISVEDGSTVGSKMVVTCWYVPSGECNCEELPCDWPNPCRFMICSKIVCRVSHTESPAGWPPDPPISTGGGGSNTPPSTPTCTPTANCGQLRSLIVQGKEPCGGCGPGPVIVVPPELYNPDNAVDIVIDTSITNNYPCLSLLLTDLPNVNRETQKFLYEAFGLQTRMNLVFATRPFADSLIDAETASPIYINNPSSQNFYDTIYLNPFSISHATKEYTVATIMHESFHAYYNWAYSLYIMGLKDSNWVKTNFPLFWDLGVSPTATSPWLSQHEEMAFSYRSKLESVVRYYYSGSAPDSIKNRVIKSLAWGGLEESTLWGMPGTDTCRILADINAARTTHYNPNLIYGNCPNYNYSFQSLSLSPPCH